MMIRKNAIVGVLCLVVLSLSACLATSTAATPSTPSVTVLNAIVAKVGARYGEPQPQLMKVHETLTDSSHTSMYIITLQGNFHKDQLQATGLEFSMLADGSKVWALRAFTATNSQVWVDSVVPITA